MLSIRHYPSQGILTDSFLPLSVNFSSLVYAYTINLEGNISVAAFPVLQNVTSININTSLPIDCSSFDAAKARASKHYDPESGLSFGPFVCYSTVAAINPGLSAGAKAGIGVGVSVAVIAAVALIWWWWMKRRRGKRNMVKLRSDGHVLQPRTMGETNAPSADHSALAEAAKDR
ncbi:hypothetical protein VTN77DRAFT_7379 [Rasamsonia byssochlamydoides]|uniref:uncharacterized protein n=1 Tax=Rasamsonia byssochlamydoides TaxID=89139 RepID=UPI003742781F